MGAWLLFLWRRETKAPRGPQQGPPVPWCCGPAPSSWSVDSPWEGGRPTGARPDPPRAADEDVLGQRCRMTVQISTSQGCSLTVSPRTVPGCGDCPKRGLYSHFPFWASDGKARVLLSAVSNPRDTEQLRMGSALRVGHAVTSEGPSSWEAKGQEGGSVLWAGTRCPRGAERGTRNGAAGSRSVRGCHVSPLKWHFCGDPVPRRALLTSAGVTEASPLPAQGKEQRIKVPQDGNPEKMTHGLTLLEPIFLHLVETGPAAPAPTVESYQAVRATCRRGCRPGAGGRGAPAPPHPHDPAGLRGRKDAPPPRVASSLQGRPGPQQEHFCLTRWTEAGAPGVGSSRRGVLQPWSRWEALGARNQQLGSVGTESLQLLPVQAPALRGGLRLPCPCPRIPRPCPHLGTTGVWRGRFALGRLLGSLCPCSQSSCAPGAEILYCWFEHHKD